MKKYLKRKNSNICSGTITALLDHRRGFLKKLNYAGNNLC